MNILIPMAGEGRRFIEAGYKESKPTIPVYDKRTGKKVPMVVGATFDLPCVLPRGENVIYVERDFHKKMGVEEKIRQYFSGAQFITIDYLTEGQACTCLVAEKDIDNCEELLIAGCDNGMEYSFDRFDEYRKKADVLVFTYRHNEAVLVNPEAYGWMIVDGEDNIVGTSIKRAISDNPMEDHAVVATFWFREGRIFAESARKMIKENDRINHEFYVDEVVRHAIELGYKAKVFEVERYIGWGTPEDYELYQRTFEYWRGFYEKEYGN